MPDFTSALYLGLRHASATLAPWRCLTTGAPAALRPPPGEAQTAAALARLVGCERAVLAPSTLHLAWDLFGQLARRRMRLLVDAAAYPIAGWGAERAAARGTPLERFAHLDADDLAARLRTGASSGRRPIVVTDGACVRCGRIAPLTRYLELARMHGGLVVMDDTQALGVLGAGAGTAAPYGYGGGGTMRWHGAGGPGLLVMASLAKGFGAPVAMLAGTTRTIAAFEHASATRVHCSPPSAAALAAAARALALNTGVGDELRARLAAGVARLRDGLAAAGAPPAVPHALPVQPLDAPLPARALHAGLQRRGVRAVLHGGHDGDGARVSLIVTARHTSLEIDRATDAVAGVVAVGRRAARRPLLRS